MHRLEDRSDEVLVELAIRGESDSFAILVERHRRKSLRIAYGVVHDSADAEDAVQNSFIKAYRKLSGFRRSGTFSSWFYRIVVNEAIRIIRTRRGKGDVELDSERIVSEGVDTERALLVRQCLASLPERLRLVLALRGVEELDYSEIAEILDLPLGTVRSRLHEARGLFAKCWKEAMTDDM